MSIKILSPIDEAYLSQLKSAKSSAEDADDPAASFSEALTTAKEMIASQDLSDAEKNAVRAMAVDAAVDAIRENGGYGLSLDSSLAKSLGISQTAVSTTPQITDASSVQVETAAEASARNATSEAAQAAAASAAADTDDVSSSSASESTKAAGTSSDDVTINSGELACSDTLNDYFEEASTTYDVDIKLLKCIALVESDFDADCTSSAGAMGIMQLMPDTAAELGVEDAYDSYENIMGGAKYISQLLDKYDGDIALAAAAYNAGPGAVAKYDGIPPYEHTQKYVTKVLSYYNS